MNTSELSGDWHSTYGYQVGHNEHMETSEEDLTFVVEDDILTGVSPTQPDGAQLALQLLHDPETRTLTGTWQETTSADGRYQGRIFHGAVQFILDQAYTTATGAWLGFSSDMTRVKHGEWRLQRAVNQDSQQ